MAIVTILFLTNTIYSQITPEFKGVPSTKISEGGVSNIVDKLSNEKSASSICEIKTDGNKYYWYSRNNKELVKIVAGAFVTYVAIDGSGYVRVIMPEFKSAASQMGDTEAKFDYVEHLLMGLKSVTYYGKSQ